MNCMYVLCRWYTLVKSVDHFVKVPKQNRFRWSLDKSRGKNVMCQKHKTLILKKKNGFLYLSSPSPTLQYFTIEREIEGEEVSKYVKIIKLNILLRHWSLFGKLQIKPPFYFLSGKHHPHLGTKLLQLTQGWAVGTRSFQKNATFLSSFPFFIKERNVFCVLFRSL